jgi:predicted chitinase
MRSYVYNSQIFWRYFSKNGGEKVHITKEGKTIKLEQPKKQAAIYALMDTDNRAVRQKKYEDIANIVYGGSRLGNGDEKEGNGYKYRGRGLIQLTGLTNYENFSKSPIGTELGFTWGDNGPQDLKANPDLVTRDASTIVSSACWYWDRTLNRKEYREKNGKKTNELADENDIENITWVINGGQNGIKDRKNILTIAKNVLGIS